MTTQAAPALQTPLTLSAPRLLNYLIRSRQPIIAIASAEEQRVQTAVLAIAEKLRVTVYPPAGSNAKPKKMTKAVVVWTLSDGLRPILGDPLPNLQGASAGDSKKAKAETFALLAGLGKSTRDSGEALRYIRAWATNTGSEQPTIFIFKDLNLTLTNNEGELQAPLTARLLRDVAAEFVHGYHTLLLVGPDFVVPPFLDKDMAFIDWPLPTREELTALYAETIEQAEVEDRAEAQEAAEHIISACQGLTALDAQNALSFALVAQRGHLGREAGQHIVAMKAQMVRKSGLMTFIPPALTDADEGGLLYLKQAMADARTSLTPLAAAYGLQPARGILIVGVPGTGKSKFTTIAGGGELPVLDCSMPALKGGLVGQSVANLRRVLKLADALGRCVLRVDEIDKVFGGGQGEFDGNTTLEMLGTFLTWMQEHTSPVLVLATCNSAARLPSALLRRFNSIFFVDLPPRADRIAIWDIQLRAHKQDPAKLNLEQLAEATEGYTGDEIRKIVGEALARGFREGCRPLNEQDYVQAVPAIIPIARTAAEEIAQMRAWASGRARLASVPDEVSPFALPSGPTGRHIEHDDEPEN